MSNELLNNLDKLHTIQLGIERIKRNLGIGDEDITAWCREKIKNATAITRTGKNWYADIENAVILKKL